MEIMSGLADGVADLLGFVVTAFFL